MSADKEQQEIKTLIDAGAKVVEVVTYERQRVQAYIKCIAEEKNLDWFRWSKVSGLEKWDNQKEDLIEFDTMAKEPINMLENFRKPEFNGILIIEDLHPYLDPTRFQAENVEIIRHLREICTLPKDQQKWIILCQPITMIPTELIKEVPLIEVELPHRETLEIIFDSVVQDFKLTEKHYKKTPDLINAALGLTIMEARIAFSKAVVETGNLNEDSISYVIKEKEDIIKKKGLLEYFHPEDTLDTVGGLDNLKDWLKRRGKAFRQGAQEFGLDKPRGVLLLGIPGCGKSLSAKAIARAWNFPLLRFDLGKVYGGIVGQSEQNIRNALDIAKALAPCVLWIDEIEKGLSGVKSSNQTDSGVSARVFGTFLTWMQEKKEPVFVVATANDVEQLPPELLRKGRFDEIFFVDLPTAEEREEIFKIHLTKKRPSLVKKFNLEELSKLSDRFTGAEIEETIKEGLFRAFDKDREIEPEDIVAAIGKITPLITTMGDVLDKLRKWAKFRTTYASSQKLKEVEKDLEKSKDKQIPILRNEMRNPFIGPQKKTTAGGE